jgi:DNA-binding PadR family transcriptional regulator
MTEPFNPQLLRGSLDLMVLSVLAEGPNYGYILQQRLREASAEMIDLQAGTLYPLLHRLEDDKLIRSKWDDSTGRRRKWYELTRDGRARLKVQAREWNTYAQCIMRLIGPVLETSPKPA